MILKAHSDKLYLLEPQARIRAGGLFYIGGANDYCSRPNDANMVILTIIFNVMLSAAKEKCGALIYNSKELEAIRTTLNEMGHPKPATRIITDNSMVDGITRGIIQQKRTKAM